MAGNVIVNALWHLNVYGAIMKILLFGATHYMSFWCSTMPSYQKLTTKDLYSRALYNNMNLYFPLYFIQKTSIWTV